MQEDLMRLRDCLVRHTENILEHSSGAADVDPADCAAARVRELLLQGYKLGFEVTPPPSPSPLEPRPPLTAY